MPSDEGLTVLLVTHCLLLVTHSYRYNGRTRRWLDDYCFTSAAHERVQRQRYGFAPINRSLKVCAYYSHALRSVEVYHGQNSAANVCLDCRCQTLSAIDSVRKLVPDILIAFVGKIICLHFAFI